MIAVHNCGYYDAYRDAFEKLGISLGDGTTHFLKLKDRKIDKYREFVNTPKYKQYRKEGRERESKKLQKEKEDEKNGKSPAYKSGIAIEEDSAKVLKCPSCKLEGHGSRITSKCPLNATNIKNYAKAKNISENEAANAIAKEVWVVYKASKAKKQSGGDRCPSCDGEDHQRTSSKKCLLNTNNVKARALAMGLTDSQEDINKAMAQIVAEIDAKRRNNQVQGAQQVDGNNEMDVDTGDKEDSNAGVAPDNNVEPGDEPVVDYGGNFSGSHNMSVDDMMDSIRGHVPGQNKRA